MSRNRTSGVAILMVACGLIAEAGSPLQADVLHVRREAAGANDGRTWDDAFREFSDALTAARAGDEIWVAAGTYKPAPDGLDRTASFGLRSGVSVYGGFAGTEVRREARDPNPETNGTILDGDLNDDDAEGVVVRPDNSLHVLVGSGTDATAVLDGFTIRGGYADGPSDALEGAGAGLLNDHGSPTLRGCVFTDNVARRGGRWPTSTEATRHSMTARFGPTLAPERATSAAGATPAVEVSAVACSTITAARH